ncbi:MAG TPA: glycoside hydrolase family 9 protein [Opitutus sp.]|nr:glycoside hydrolase family 9 protein [Opitutus sp.]
MKYLPWAAVALFGFGSIARGDDALILNEQEYLEMPGLNVMLAHDFYPEGHQGGVGIIQNGERVATNGDLRLEPTPGQWQPTPAVGKRQVDRAAQEISVRMSYPDEKNDRKGFNPISYPDLKMSYAVRVRPDGKAFRIVVDLDQPLPADWVGKVGFNLELFPGILFGKSFSIGDQFGIFPRQADGPGEMTDGDYELAAFGRGRKLVIAPESDRQRMTIEAVRGGELVLLDGRAQHNNGWFVVRALVPAAATKGAIEWLVSPHAIPDWKSAPVIQVSQVGYQPRQEKIAVIELDRNDRDIKPVSLYRARDDGGGLEKVLEQPAKDWGRFLRYHDLQFDFSRIERPGMYVIGYGDERSNAFQISGRVYERHVWQPTVEVFLPVQMCHMRVNDRYRVWHGVCHIDDALMAPPNHNHFDGYAQGPSTLTTFHGGDHVPGLDRGGWHDAGDYDLRIESQADTVHGLALAWELFHPTLDDTTIDETQRIAELHRPDGKPDILQQIEHGVLSIVGGYHAMGRLYRGMQDASLHQYTHLGDARDMTDNRVFHDTDGLAINALAKAAVNGSQAEPPTGLAPLGSDGSADDRWVFTEENPMHELQTAAALAAASRVLKGFDDPLAADCLKIAQELWANTKADRFPLLRVEPAIELLQATGASEYANAIVGLADEITSTKERSFGRYRMDPAIPAALGARSLLLIHDAVYRAKVMASLRAYRKTLDRLEAETPYGLPYKPQIWGAGWEIEWFGVQQFWLHAAAPDLFPADGVFRALNFVLGCHPGANNASFVSGVGAKSMIPAYGANRADWSYIPGGIASGTALIRPDFAELLEWPYLWQQGEYCLGYPTSDYVFLVLAADRMFKGT